MLLNLVEYHWAEHIDDALLLLARLDIKTVPLAGGSYLLGLQDDTISAVVDLRELDLRVVEDGADVVDDHRVVEMLGRDIEGHGDARPLADRGTNVVAHPPHQRPREVERQPAPRKTWLVLNRDERHGESARRGRRLSHQLQEGFEPP